MSVSTDGFHGYVAATPTAARATGPPARAVTKSVFCINAVSMASRRESSRWKAGEPGCGRTSDIERLALSADEVFDPDASGSDQAVCTTRKVEDSSVAAAPAAVASSGATLGAADGYDVRGYAPKVISVAGGTSRPAAAPSRDVAAGWHRATTGESNGGSAFVLGNRCAYRLVPAQPNTRPRHIVPASHVETC